MRILISLMYYRPHYSGLTIYSERLAKALAARGHQVTVLTSRFSRSLPAHEEIDGITIVRPDVLLRVSKGVIMPSMPVWAWRLVRQADVVNTHVPQPDAALLGIYARLFQKPVVLTYHCDLDLPNGFVNFFANQGSHLANHVSASLADAIVTNTRDFAEHSPFLNRYNEKVIEIPPPIELVPVSKAQVGEFREKYGILPGQRVIGMAARLATEKGVEYLVDALPQVLKRFPEARVLFAGQHQGVLGEEAYAQALSPCIRALGRHWKFLGILPPAEWSAFFHIAEVTVLPSINSTESFGMVQVESMTCGTPVIASDLPGVRQPVRSTGMGLIVQPQDSKALAQALIEVLHQPDGYRADQEAIKNRFSPAQVAVAYEGVFARLLESRRS
ncbi:MAG TPA: glycosyltransferase family 4 protein [Anaerolineales bacterium]|nr:glycosyltransferase family 4 protein [Anaerolineales bacterium]